MDVSSDNEKKHGSVLTVLYIVVSVTAIIVLSYLLVKCDRKEKFCGTCKGVGLKTHPNRELLHKLYNEGKLTEFSDFDAEKRQWKSTNFDKY